MEWQKTFKKAIWLVFGTVLMTCAIGCSTTTECDNTCNLKHDWIEMLDKGDPAPADGFWLSKETFLTLYEAAEKSAALYVAPANLQGSQVAKR